jgi:hypothetical protein
MDLVEILETSLNEFAYSDESADGIRTLLTEIQVSAMSDNVRCSEDAVLRLQVWCTFCAEICRLSEDPSTSIDDCVQALTNEFNSYVVLQERMYPLEVWRAVQLTHECVMSVW